jgi:hypothetical protein
MLPCVAKWRDLLIVTNGTPPSATSEEEKSTEANGYSMAGPAMSGCNGWEPNRRKT